jgi:hypothetical protein
MTIKQNSAEMTDEFNWNPEHESGADSTQSGALVPVSPRCETLLPTLKEPDAPTIVSQVIDTQRVPEDTEHETQLEIKMGPIAHYAAIEAEDGLESALARVIVGVTNGTMDCFGRAARNTEWPKAREVDLRYGIKGALALTELVKAFDNHRSRDRIVAVGQVNVQSGGQAIVGNVGAQPQRVQAAASPTAPIAAHSPGDDRKE